MNPKIAAMLSTFDLNDLNVFELREYNHFVRKSSKEDTLQMIISSANGDYSKLSRKLSEIAKLENDLKQTTKNIKKFIKEVFLLEEFDANYRNEILKIINRAYLYNVQVLALNYPRKFLDKTIKKYTQENYENDLNTLKSFDINLLYDKSFWGIGVSSSITALATGPYTKLKKLLRA
jgi:hypothetical protein